MLHAEMVEWPELHILLSEQYDLRQVICDTCRFKMATGSLPIESQPIKAFVKKLSHRRIHLATMAQRRPKSDDGTTFSRNLSALGLTYP